jgi:tRNA(Ile)-lysidine synthase
LIKLLDPAPILSLLAAYPTRQRLVVGYSGGVDSHVLLHVLAQQRVALAGKTLAAVYIDHGLQPEASCWGEHCAAICRKLAVPFTVLRVTVRARPGESPEAAARSARYRAFAALLDEASALLTAHQQDDQAETVLLQLLRGTGPRGLAAMPLAAPLGTGLLLRPLLEISREAILAYAEYHRLRWIEDPSNAHLTFDRNFLRQEILPCLRQRWPGVARTLGRSALLCGEVSELLDSALEDDIKKAVSERADALLLAPLHTLSPPRQRNLLRGWLRSLGLPVPNRAQLEKILTDVLPAAPDRQPQVSWPGAAVRRYRERLYALPPLPPHDPAAVIPWSGKSALTLPDGSIVSLRPHQGVSLRASALRELTVRFRQGGERFHPHGRRHSQTLKKLLQEADIPPWERARLPLLYAGEKLLAVADWWLAADAVCAPGEPSGEHGLVLAWQKLPRSVNV